MFDIKIFWGFFGTSMVLYGIILNDNIFLSKYFSLFFKKSSWSQIVFLKMKMRAFSSQVVFRHFSVFQKSKSLWPNEKWTKINVHF